MRRTENPEIQVQILSVPHQASLVACFGIAPLYKTLRQRITVLYPTWLEGFDCFPKNNHGAVGRGFNSHSQLSGIVQWLKRQKYLSPDRSRCPRPTRDSSVGRGLRYGRSMWS